MLYSSSILLHYSQLQQSWEEPRRRWTEPGTSFCRGWDWDVEEEGGVRLLTVWAKVFKVWLPQLHWSYRQTWPFFITKKFCRSKTFLDHIFLVPQGNKDSQCDWHKRGRRMNCYIQTTLVSDKLVLALIKQNDSIKIHCLNLKSSFRWAKLWLLKYMFILCLSKT